MTTEPTAARCPAQTENNPPPDSSFTAPAHYPEAGNMPVIAGIQWESKKYGVEAWHSPEGKRNRAGKVYLGRLGKHRLAELFKLPDEARRAAVGEWIAERRAAKQIE